MYASFRKMLPNGQEVEALGQALYASNDAAAIKRFQNQWHHLVIRGAKASGQVDVEIAVDGVVNTSRVAAGIQTTSVTTHVGCNVNSDNPRGEVTTAGGDPYESFDGKLDEITVYGGHISDRLVAALHAQSTPATRSFGYLVGAPREASDDKVIAVDPLLDRLKELNATRYALEVKGVGDLSQARRVLSAIEARIATNHDAAFWRNFRLLVDGRVQNYGGLRENLTGLGKGLVDLKHEHPNTFGGFKIDDFSTVARTDSSMANPDRLAMLCDETMKEPTLSLEPVVYCDSGSDPTLKQYGGGSWSKKGATKDHAMFRDIQRYLQSEYQNGKYARCLSGVTMYISPDDSGPDRPTYVDDNAAKLNGCLDTLRETGLPITEGIYSSSTASTSVPETTRLKNLEAARRTTPNAFEAFTLPSLDGSAMTRALQSAYGDPAHFIRW